VALFALTSGRWLTVEILVNGKVLSTGTASGPSNEAIAEICQATGEWGNCN
jgi:hypothetical protein